ncbi:alpha/beta hydrolase [Streptomyces sp. NPDC002787]
MLSLQELKGLKLTELVDAARGWSEISKKAYSSRDRVNNEIVATLTDTQENMSAVEAVIRLGRLARNYQYIHTECGLVSAALNGLAEELAGPQRSLLEALAEAESMKFEVFDDGSVRYPPATSSDTELPGDTVSGADDFFSRALRTTAAAATLNPNAALAQGIANRIATALSEANSIDEQYSVAVGKLKAAEGLEVTDATWADVNADASAVHGAVDDVFKDDIPTDKSAAERKEWWDGLSEDDRIAYMAIYPDTIGNLDGIPADARDEANRTYLPQLMGKLESQGGEDAQTKLDGLRKIDEQLRAGSEPPMYLLGIGDEGQGRAIVSYGNPDTSKNVSAYVPGLSTKLDSEFADGTLKRARDTAIGARELDRSSASIIWLGYDAPLGADVAVTGDAERGAPAYQEFMSGIAATNDHSDPHVTAIGHSYGSLTVGTASQQPGGMPDVDDYILLGSPGVGVDRAEDLGVGRDHVFVGAAGNDLVTHAPSTGSVVGGAIGAGAGWALGGPIGGGVGLVVGADVGDPGDDDNWFGRDPVSEEFGAIRMRTDDGPPAWTNGFEAHSNYFNPEKDQVSADNIAKIVAGNPDSIVREDHR